MFDSTGLDQQQSGSQQDDQNQIEVANAPGPIEFEEEREDQKRRHVHPRRFVDSFVGKRLHGKLLMTREQWLDPILDFLAEP